MSLCMAPSLNDHAGKAADIGGSTHTFRDDLLHRVTRRLLIAVKLSNA